MNKNNNFMINIIIQKLDVSVFQKKNIVYDVKKLYKKRVVRSGGKKTPPKVSLKVSFLFIIIKSLFSI